MARAVVIGGGLAGCAAAIALAEAGREVILVEKRATLGGRASSYRAAGWPEPVDSSQHILLRCCTNLLGLYERLGLADRIVWQDSFDLVDASGHRARFTAGRLPAPAHLLPGLLAIPGLSSADRLKLALTFGRMLLVGRRYPSLDQVSFADWLGAAGGAGATRAFWRLMVASGLNASPARSSAASALMFFLEGLMRHPAGWRLGVPDCPLAVLHHEAMGRYLGALGVEIRLGTVAQITDNGRRVTGAIIDGQRLEAGEGICAVQQHQAARAVPGLAAPLRHTAGRLRTESIVGIQLRFAEPVTDRPLTGLLDHDIDWIFSSRQGCQLSLVVSDAADWRGLGRVAMVERGLAAVREVLGELPPPLLTAACCEQRATFVPLPGAAANRPAQAMPLGGLALAGEWTSTGWPSTMEGAVRSGYRAAGVLTGQEAIVPDLPAAGLMRWSLRP